VLQLVPGLHLSAPRDATRLREALATAVSIDDAPTVLRYSKEAVPADLVAVDRLSGHLDGRRPGVGRGRRPDGRRLLPRPPRAHHGDRKRDQVT